MRLATRLAAGYGLAIAVLAGMGVYQLAAIGRLQATNRELSRVSLTAVSTALRVRRGVEQVRELTAKLFVLGDPDYAAVLGELRQQVDPRVAALGALDLEGAERLEVDRLVELWAAYRRTADEAEPRALRGRGGSSRAAQEAGAAAARDAVAGALDAVVRQLDEVLRVAQVGIGSRVARSTDQAGRARWVTLGATAAGVLAALAVSLLIVRSVVVPVRRLARGTHALARGEFAHRVEAAGGPELAGLAADFNAMAARLDALDRAKRDFVSNVSHDLKAPLAAVQETLRLLLDRLPGPLTAQQERLLGLGLGSAERLAGMIADLLDLARLDDVALRYRFAPHDLRELARTALRGFEPLAHERRLRLALDLPKTPVTVECDGPLVVRVLENLLSNAVRFAPPESAVELAVNAGAAAVEAAKGAPAEAARTAAADGAVLVEVGDRGPGVPDADKEAVFERFRSSRPGRGPGAGTGLGLAIARSVVEGHGGAVWLRDRPHGGTVAAVLLPVRVSAERRRDLGERAV